MGLSIVNVDHEQNRIVNPNYFYLEQNYPNPFNPVTVINYSIPNVGFTLQQNIVLKVYDVLGREVVKLVDKKLNSGYYKVEWDAADYPSGIYFYNLQSGNYSNTKKMILLK